MAYIRRRDLITLLGSSAAAAWPLVAKAQQPAIPVVGVLDVGTDSRFSVFRQSLAETGYVEGRNVRFEHRSSATVERWPELAADLVRRRVTMIASLSGIPSAMAAKAATTTIPVVFTGGFDPVEIGLVASLARPGGNITGATNLGLELGPKRLEVIHELFPAAKTFALLVNPDHPNTPPQLRDMQAAATATAILVRADEVIE
jgi:putative tryptophan/tyrosine transport system substrate-binding protein